MIRLLEFSQLEIFQLGYLNKPADSKKASKVDASMTNVPGQERVTRQPTLVKNEAVAAAYLRAAQAYILISMPTGTSTIFGVFQAILALLVKPDELRPPNKVIRIEKFASEIFLPKFRPFLCCAATATHGLVRAHVKPMMDQWVHIAANRC